MNTFNTTFRLAHLVKHKPHIKRITFIVFAFLLTLTINAQRNEFPSSSWGIGPQINTYYGGNTILQLGIAAHYEKNMYSWFSLRQSIILEFGSYDNNVGDYINLVINPTAFFRVTGDNGLNLSAGGHIRLANEIGRDYYHESFYYLPLLAMGPAFAIGGRMRKNRKDYGAIELMILNNPIRIRMGIRRSPLVFQLNYHFPLKN